MDLIKMIIKEVQNLETSGRLNEIIATNVEKTVTEIIKDSFRSYGAATKEIEKALKDKLSFSLENIEIAQYNKIISHVVGNKINASVSTDLIAKVEKEVNKVTGVLEKKEWKLSEIIEKFIDQIDKSHYAMDGNESDKISLYVSDDNDFCHVRFDAQSKRAEYECENKLFIYKNKLSSVVSENKQMKPLNNATFNEFESFLFNLYVNDVTIEIDEYDVEEEYVGEWTYK